MPGSGTQAEMELIARYRNSGYEALADGVLAFFERRSDLQRPGVAFGPEGPDGPEPAKVSTDISLVAIDRSDPEAFALAEVILRGVSAALERYLQERPLLRDCAPEQQLFVHPIFNLQHYAPGEGFRRWQAASWAAYGQPGAQTREEQDVLMAEADALQAEWFYAFLESLFGTTEYTRLTASRTCARPPTKRSSRNTTPTSSPKHDPTPTSRSSRSAGRRRSIRACRRTSATTKITPTAERSSTPCGPITGKTNFPRSADRAGRCASK